MAAGILAPDFGRKKSAILFCPTGEPRTAEQKSLVCVLTWQYSCYVRHACLVQVIHQSSACKRNFHSTFSQSFKDIEKSNLVKQAKLHHMVDSRMIMPFVCSLMRITKFCSCRTCVFIYIWISCNPTWCAASKNTDKPFFVRKIYLDQYTECFLYSESKWNTGWNNKTLSFDSMASKRQCCVPCFHACF